jgi:hypothetical protein
VIRATARELAELAGLALYLIAFATAAAWVLSPIAGSAA